MPAKKEQNINTIDFLEIIDVQNDILITKDKYIKILKIHPINYDLKSEFEKQSILNSYKTVFKVCSFNFQILVLSEKENINKNINKLNSMFFSRIDNLDKTKFLIDDVEQIEEIENKKTKLNTIYSNYIQYIESLNQEENITSKSFYIVIYEEIEKDKQKDVFNVLKEMFVQRKNNREKNKEETFKNEKQKVDDSSINNAKDNKRMLIENARKNLNSKEKSIIASISKCGNQVKVLTGNEIYNLFVLIGRRENA